MPDPTDPPGSFARLTARARRAAQTLKDEYEAGKRGEDAPAAPIWATPAEQLDAAVRLVRAAAGRAPTDDPDLPRPDGDDDGAVTTGSADEADDPAASDLSRPDGRHDGHGATGPGDDGSAADDLSRPDGGNDGQSATASVETEASEVAGAIRRVDWAAVRTATADRSSDAARAARTLAAQVDWDRVQPAARRVSMALIGAMASGQLGVAGPLGPLVAKAIVDQGGFGGRVEHRLADDGADPLPTDLTAAIETTAREVPGE